MYSLTYAVDFDGTLCENAWPEIGEPNHDLIDMLKYRRRKGHKVILWTCRQGMHLVNAHRMVRRSWLIFRCCKR